VKVAIIGLGVVGHAQARMFAGRLLVTYDVTDNDPYPEAEIAGCDFAVIAVGTPAAADGSADLTYLHEAFKRLPASLPVLIRSTVPPGTTAALQALHGDTPVCCAPEFMHERPGGAWRETTDVPYLILGGTPAAAAFFRLRLAAVFPGVIHECSATEAELVKYTANLYWAARVTFVNEMARICEAAGADWENVRSAWLEDPRVSPEYTGYADFLPGFGGRCWPKDLRALIAAARELDYHPYFLEAVQETNRRFRAPDQERD
jgi:UDPglucose 6-dehydrogenase